MRLTLLALTANLALLQAGEWTKAYKTGDAPTLYVRCGDANVQVTSGSSGISAHLMTKGWEIRPGEVEVVERQTGDRVDIEVKVPRGMNWNLGTGNRSMRLEITAPAKTRVHINTGDGNVKIAGLQAESRVETGDGNITGDGLAGRLDARTGDGNVQVSGRFEVLSVHTGDGNVEIDALPGSSTAAPWHIQTGDGSIDVKVPGSLRADIDAAAGDGHVRSSLPLLVSAGRIDGNSLRGRLNGGGSTISIRTGDGNVTLTESR